MNKYILTGDMPNSCSECKSKCGLDKEFEKVDFNPYYHRHPQCPLKPLEPYVTTLNKAWEIMNDGPLNNNNIQKVRYALIQTINALGGSDNEMS